MSYSKKEIREDYLEKIKKVFTGTRGVVTLDMCRATAERGLTEKSAAALMQRRIERIITDPSGKRTPAVFINKPRITKTFKEEEI